MSSTDKLSSAAVGKNAYGRRGRRPSKLRLKGRDPGQLIRLAVIGRRVLGVDGSDLDFGL